MRVRAVDTRSSPDGRAWAFNLAYDCGWQVGYWGGHTTFTDATGGCREQYLMGIRHGREARAVALQRHNR
jgi:hypothetical protein